MKRWIIWGLTSEGKYLWFIGKSGTMSLQPYMYDSEEGGRDDLAYFKRVNTEANWQLKEVEFSGKAKSANAEGRLNEIQENQQSDCAETVSDGS